jgi:hypothetical protein
MNWAPTSSSAILLGTVLILAACRSGGPVHPHEPLRANAEPLRSAFNADSGRVRAIFLASPT